MGAELSLAERMDAEFAAASKKKLEQQDRQLQEYEKRRDRLKRIDQTMDELRSVWRPRLEALKQRFESQVKVTPSIQTGNRRVTFEFTSEVASIELRFSALADEAAENLVFYYDLQIIPAYVKYESHDEFSLALQNIDREALGKWLDERIISFVQTYLQLFENERYLKDHMVEDPVAKVRFPKFAAGSTKQWKGKTVYFINDETRREFEKQQATA